jgi:hypothetical protein
MSRSFRPVVETWGEASSCFRSTDLVAELIEEIAGQAGTHAETLDYGSDFRVVWVADGAAFLDAIEEGQFDLGEIESCELLDENKADLDTLMGNVKALAKKWRKSLDPTDGTLRFYLDV